MPVTYKATSATAYASGGVTTVAWPAGHKLDDLGIIVMRTNGTAVTVPAGWNLAHSVGANTYGIALLWRRAASTTEGSVTFPTNTTVESARILVFSGVSNTLAAINAVGGDTAPFTGTTTTPGPVTTESCALFYACVTGVVDNPGAVYTSANISAPVLIASSAADVETKLGKSLIVGNVGSIGFACGAPADGRQRVTAILAIPHGPTTSTNFMSFF